MVDVAFLTAEAEARKGRPDLLIEKLVGLDLTCGELEVIAAALKGKSVRPAHRPKSSEHNSLRRAAIKKYIEFLQSDEEPCRLSKKQAVGEAAKVWRRSDRWIRRIVAKK